MLRQIKPKGQAVLEYMFLLVFIGTAFLVFQKYIAGAMGGRWQSTGESLGFGREYDPHKTVECAYAYKYFESVNGVWYNALCYDERGCESKCFSKQPGSGVAECKQCITQCAAPICDE